MPFTPHTQEDIDAMLTRIGVPTIETLFDEIPQVLRHTAFKSLDEGLNEMDMLSMAHRLAAKNHQGTCFIGAGAYEHHIPAAVWDIASRGEFLTAYTPYQAEASQGTLQLLYEYQSMMAELTGMDVANASMYDGASALAEAVLMAHRLRPNISRVLITDATHPFYRETLNTLLHHQQIALITLPMNPATGVTDLTQLKTFADEAYTAIVISQPNFFGCLEPVDALTDWAEKNQMLSVACVNPISLGCLKPPGQWGEHGVDIACGEGQPLGCPLASGGPYFGFFTTRMAHVRQMPGRLIGQTIDVNGQPGYTLTLQAREQHIRRAKATSNVCTNQGLLVTAATLHMSLLGPHGLKEVALRCHHQTHELIESLIQLPGVRLVFNAPYFHEALLAFEQPVDMILSKLSAAGIAGGFPVKSDDPKRQNTLLICATEKRTPEDITRYVAVLKDILTC